MKRTAVMLAATLVLGIAVGAVGGRAGSAQQTGVRRTILLKTELAGIEGKEAFLGQAELAPSAAAGRHSHHGHELGYVLEGSGILEIEGKPPIAVKAGDVYHIEANQAHDATNTGPTPLRVLAVWIVDKGRPLAVPAP